MAIITDVNHTDVERQSIGNCWLYAQASWVESMHLTATGEAFDTSQSYWTYWHWFDEIKGGFEDEISTGGNQWTSNALVKKRGLMILLSDLLAPQEDVLRALRGERPRCPVPGTACARNVKHVTAGPYRGSSRRCFLLHITCLPVTELRKNLHIQQNPWMKAGSEKRRRGPLRRRANNNWESQYENVWSDGSCHGANRDSVVSRG